MFSFPVHTNRTPGVSTMATRKRNRKGKGARHRDSEKFRYYKNCQFDSKLTYLRDLDIGGFLTASVSTICFERDFHQYIEVHLSGFTTDLHDDDFVMRATHCSYDHSVQQVLDQISSYDDDYLGFDLLPYGENDIDEHQYYVSELYPGPTKTVGDKVFLGEPGAVVFVGPGQIESSKFELSDPNCALPTDTVVVGGSIFITDNFQFLECFGCPGFAYLPPRPLWYERQKGCDNPIDYDDVLVRIRMNPNVSLVFTMNTIFDDLIVMAPSLSDSSYSGFSQLRALRDIKRADFLDDYYAILSIHRPLLEYELYSWKSNQFPVLMHTLQTPDRYEYQVQLESVMIKIPMYRCQQVTIRCGHKVLSSDRGSDHRFSYPPIQYYSLH